MKKQTLINTVNVITEKLRKKVKLHDIYDELKLQQGRVIAMPIEDYQEWFGNTEPVNYDKVHKVVQMFNSAMSDALMGKRMSCVNKLKEINSTLNHI